ncbi:type II secretion system protein GspD [Aporhodopirellula aestuarii]|uniref:Type II and III secretion system protein n=1 Tax=Aporhodopirellula aestuarii TaxID=2950107 RepID=A0ABT0TYX3_9BACT|nr:secretin N-terminal domain-containing protein [Aporhodopirellula aestuarii]MCM2369579.1 hypothetical protein [Aporhodopirellula aestuarii]
MSCLIAFEFDAVGTVRADGLLPGAITREVTGQNALVMQEESYELNLQPEDAAARSELPIGDLIFPQIHTAPASHRAAPFRLATAKRSSSASDRLNATPVVFQNSEPTLNAPNELLMLPLPDAISEPIDLHAEDGLITLSVRKAPLADVLSAIAKSQGLSILTTDDIDTTISGNFTRAHFEDVMSAIFAISPYTWTRSSNVILVTRLDGGSSLPPHAQGREIRVFELNYVSADDVQNVIKPLLSGVGNISITQTNSRDQNKTRERVIVEEIPQYMERIERYVAQVDRPPRQVLIEAHILEVDLKDDTACGVDLSKLSNTSGTGILLSTPDFNNTISSLSTLSSSAYNIGIFKAGDLSGLVEAITRTEDAKALASPRVLALNGQEAYVQIGEKLGYFVTTTTQTSSLQSVEFLDTGVVLRVTPQIMDDDSVVMSVKPEVSDGSVDERGLPSERTTEVDTTIMLANGTGMVIGGLIKETDSERIQKIPLLGSIPYVGRLFRRINLVSERSEIIIALVPHVLPCPHPQLPSEIEAFDRATTPLFYGPLKEFPRPWEPKLTTDNGFGKSQNKSSSVEGMSYFPTDD